VGTRRVAGRTSQRERTVPFMAGDGLACNLIHVTGPHAPDRRPVILVHGAGVRAEIFRAPVRRHLVDLLLEEGYDVWLLNWRASIDHRPNEWTLDQAALYDHPRAVRKVVEETGSRELAAIIHCQGSTSFAMSAVAGLVPEVTTIVSNAVSLHPIAPPVTRAKTSLALPVISRLTRYLDPSWGRNAPTPFAKALRAFVLLTHRECDNNVCRMASFTYGVGFPTLWRHEQLDDATHDWLSNEFGPVSIAFFQQMARCLRAGHLVSTGRHPELPESFVTSPPGTTARWALFAGERNRCFLPESQVRTWEWLESHQPGRHSVNLVPGYSHLDIFMGKTAANDVLPQMVEALED
jgi:hypothetical protein